MLQLCSLLRFCVDLNVFTELELLIKMSQNENVLTQFF